MNLEKYVHAKIRKDFSGDSLYRDFTGKNSLQELTRADIEAYQLFMFRRMIDYAVQKSSFYQKRYANLKKVKSLADIASVPLTEAEDLRQSPYDMLCIGMGDIARTFSHTTTGTTTGEPKRIFFAHSDADIIVDTMEAVLQTALGGTGSDGRGSRVHIFLPNNGGPLSIAGLIARGAEQMGCVPVIGDCFENTEEQIRSIKETKPDMIMGSAFRIWRITQEAREFHDLPGIGVKRIFITSEYLSVPMRGYLEEWWRAEVYHHYGMSEPGFVIGIECDRHDGFHFNESDLYFEVINPDTGRVIENEGEGELVLTTLNRVAMPLIRYRTGDIARLIRKPCECGASTLIRIGRLPRRHALEVTIGAETKIFSSLFDEALHQIPELIDYRIFISRENGKDLLECVVEVLRGDTGIGELLIRQLLTIPAVKKCLDDGLLGPPRIRYTKRGELRRGGTSQKRRIKDNR